VVILEYGGELYGEGNGKENKSSWVNARLGIKAVKGGKSSRRGLGIK